MEQTKLEDDKNIITSIVNEMRDDLYELLKSYHDNYIFSENYTNTCIDDLFGIFMKILFRIKRFANFKSSVKILLKNDKLSRYDRKRCKFIARLQDDGSLEIIKNEISEHKGTYVN